MQFLLQEFFKKTLKFVNSLNFTFRFVFKLILYIFILIFIVVIMVLVYTQKYIWVIVIIGLWFLAEMAHFLRKLLEKRANENVEGKKDTEKNILNPDKSKNEDVLDLEKPKNKGLLKKSKK